MSDANQEPKTMNDSVKKQRDELAKQHAERRKYASDPGESFYSGFNAGYAIAEKKYQKVVDALKHISSGKDIYSINCSCDEEAYEALKDLDK